MKNRIGLGCMGFSHAYGVAVDKNEAIQTIKKAYALGYRIVDTAQCYAGYYADGTVAYNEEIVGEALKDVRSDIYLCTKFGVKHCGDHLEFDSSRETILRSLEESLEKLQTDYIDLYYQHRIDPKVEPEEVALVMKELIEAGKIKAWGISEVNEEYLRCANAVCKVTAIQNRYSMMARWYEPLIDVCEELDITYIAFSPLANGILTGMYSNQSTFEEGDFRNRMPQYQQKGYNKVIPLLELLDEISNKYKCTSAQLSLAWILNKYPRMVVLPGSRKIERLKENFDSSLIKLTKEAIQKIDQCLNAIDFEVFGGH